VRPEDFDFLSSLLKRRSGLNINPEKVYLLESRLTPLARRRGMEGLDALIETVRNRPSEDLLREGTEEMTPNEWFFVRDRTPVDLTTSLAAAAEETLAWLDRTGGGVGRRAREGAALFAAAFERFFEEAYGGRRVRLDADRQGLRGAFVIILRGGNETPEPVLQESA